MNAAGEVSTPLLINGELTAGRGGVFATVNPATEQPLGQAADGTAADMDAAIAAARSAFDDTDWSGGCPACVSCVRR